MVQLDVSSSARLNTLKVLFGDNWREFLAAIVWDLLDEIDPEEILYTIDIDVNRRVFGVIPVKFSINYDIRVRHAIALVTRLVGSRFAKRAP